MPELPEVETVVNELNAKLKNRKIKTVVINAPKIISIGPKTVSNKREVSTKNVQNFISSLQGQKVISVTRRAKILIFSFSGELTMLVHLKMTGQFIFEDKVQKKSTGSKYRMLNRLHAPLIQLPGKHTHVIFEFADGSTLYFNDVRKFGYLKLIQNNQLPEVKEFTEYGPEPLHKNFSFEVFETALRKKKNGLIKQVIMDNSVVVGIGNIYSDEILFHAKVRPTRKVSSLKNSEIKEIFKWIKPILNKGIKAKGSSVGDFVRTDGSWGQMGKFHFVYGRKGQECKKCGTIIQSVKVGGRTGSYCPECQK